MSYIFLYFILYIFYIIYIFIFFLCYIFINKIVIFGIKKYFIKLVFLVFEFNTVFLVYSNVINFNSRTLPKSISNANVDLLLLSLLLCFRTFAPHEAKAVLIFTA